jgi:hypothetical protein
MPRYLANGYTAENVEAQEVEFWASCEDAKELTQVLSQWGEPGSLVVLIEVWDMFVSQDKPVFIIDHRIKE